jgi:hypothetical protein
MKNAVRQIQVNFEGTTVNVPLVEAKIPKPQALRRRVKNVLVFVVSNIDHNRELAAARMRTQLYVNPCFLARLKSKAFSVLIPHADF